MIQSTDEIEQWFQKDDPWEYEGNPEDEKRKDVLFSEIPQKKYVNVLDIGCGHGYVTRELPGDNIIGVDISQNAIDQAKKHNQGEKKKIEFRQGSIYHIDQMFNIKFDLIIITGVLYPQYIGNSHSLVYLIIDKILKKRGVLVSVHINEWYKSLFPFFLNKIYLYDYKNYSHRLEVYTK